MSEGVFYDYVFVSQIVYLHVSTVSVSCDCLVRYILSGQLFIWHDILEALLGLVYAKRSLKTLLCRLQNLVIVFLLFHDAACHNLDRRSCPLLFIFNFLYAVI